MESRQSESRPYEHALIIVANFAEDVLELYQPEAVEGVLHSFELGDDGQLSVVGD